MSDKANDSNKKKDEKSDFLGNFSKKINDNIDKISNALETEKKSTKKDLEEENKVDKVDKFDSKDEKSTDVDEPEKVTKRKNKFGTENNSKDDGPDIFDKVSSKFIYIVAVWLVSYIPLLFLPAIEFGRLSMTILDVIDLTTDGGGRLITILIWHVFISLLMFAALIATFLNYKKFQFKILMFAHLSFLLFVFYNVLDAWDLINPLHHSSLIVFSGFTLGCIQKFSEKNN
ncbi:MAG: hypothetical protein P8I02_00605 [Flavobacteriales bacterium]|nr:hypothetical protein [Flavobacteriales bacterium]